MISLIPGIESASSGLHAESVRMAVASQNIANANTTRGIDGQPYRRQQVVFESVMAEKASALNGMPAQMVQISRIQKDERPFKMVYDPGHPDADPQTGMVSMPNVNIHEEMADMIVSSRAYEANLAVVRNARSMALQTLNIGKR